MFMIQETTVYHYSFQDSLNPYDKAAGQDVLAVNLDFGDKCADYDLCAPPRHWLHCLYKLQNASESRVFVSPSMIQCNSCELNILETPFSLACMSITHCTSSRCPQTTGKADVFNKKTADSDDM